MGSSAGGQLVSLIGSLNGPYRPFQTDRLSTVSDKVQAVIDVDGVLAFIHPESSEGADKPGAPSAATRWLGASIAADRNRWEEASALSHVNAGSAPFLFINSAQPRFSAGQKDFISRLQSFGIYSEVHQLPETPHSFWLFHPWVDQMMPYVYDFLHRTLD
jgi:pectinesterase